MRTQAAIHDDFVARFHFGERLGPVTQSQLAEIEAELNTKLSVAYRTFMMRHGPVYTPDILHEIVEANLDHPDLQNILDPAEAIDGSKAYWSGGMPGEVIGVGSDCMGEHD